MTWQKTLCALLVGSAGVTWAFSANHSGGTLKTVRGLPSDEWMFEHFRRNRDAMEELVRLYQADQLRDWRTVDGKQQAFPTERYKELKARSLVYHVTNDGAIWLPESYSAASGAATRKMRLAQAYKHHGVIVRLEHSRSYTFSWEIGRVVWKGYFFVPVVPRIEGGWLLWPVDAKGKVFRKAKVVEGLDEFPLMWLRNPPRDLQDNVLGCVYRQIDQQWFVTLCNG